MKNVSPHWLRHAAITLVVDGDGPARGAATGRTQERVDHEPVLGGSDAELKALYKQRIG